MNERLKLMKKRVRAGKHHSLRRAAPIDILAECEAENLSWPRRVACLIKRQCEAEQVVIAPDEQIVFTRTLPAVPAIYNSEDWGRLIAGRILHELGPVSNICADWSLLLSQGLLGRKQVALESREQMADDPSTVEFLSCVIEDIDAVIGLASRYASRARELGNDSLAEILENVPAHPAITFHEALQSLRLCHAVVWLGGNYHVGLGRFDQYMWPYLKADLAAGRLTRQT
ncbi:MAG: pyruvate formate lyase family protein, partial [Anaerolineales bacterium]